MEETSGAVAIVSGRMGIDAAAKNVQYRGEQDVPRLPGRLVIHPNGARQGEASADPLEELARQLLLEIGEDPQREGLQDTPARFARWWREFTTYNPGTVDTVFPLLNVGQMVLISDIVVWSLCEHHLLPFSCNISIAYRPTDQILGLSKFARVAHQHAHKLQVQERLIADIAEDIQYLANSDDVAVVGRGEHLCTAMRGIRTPAIMTSSILGGIFAEDGPARQEFFTAIYGRG
jgi:GTP cyclohydrolase IA